MKIQFDPKQEYQLDAVNAVVELFDGQPLEKPDYSVIFQTMDTELFAGQARSELGVGNKLHVGAEKLLENLRHVQERNDLDLAEEVQAWSWAGASESLWCPHFSVEMETVTLRFTRPRNALGRKRAIISEAASQRSGNSAARQQRSDRLSPPSRSYAGGFSNMLS